MEFAATTCDPVGVGVLCDTVNPGVCDSGLQTLDSFGIGQLGKVLFIGAKISLLIQDQLVITPLKPYRAKVLLLQLL
jgi:hypothetical protein